MQATRIPPHTNRLILCKEKLCLYKESLVEVKKIASQGKSAVKEAYEEKAAENGHLTGKRLQLILEHQNSSISKLVDEKFEFLF